MFAKTVIDSDVFIEMPLSAQALYFHLGMRADDDGFVNNPRRIRNDIGAAEDDLKLLLAKRFVLTFDSGVIVIKHWRMHNYIQSDRYKPTVHTKEMALLRICENRAYTECIHDVSGLDTQVSTELEESKDRGSIVKDKENTTTTTIDSSIGRERVCEEKTPPSVTEVAVYMKDEHCVEDSAVQAEKFVAWNAMFGWDCMPDWKKAADLWVARISEREGK